MNVYFIRHGNAMKAKEDRDRQLSSKGIEQAQKRGKQLRSINFDKVIASPAIRCIATAEIVSGDCEITPIASLYIPPVETADGLAIDQAFNRLGYASLSKYLESEAKEALERYSQENASEIRRIETQDRVSNLLVLGHAVLIQAIIMNFVNDNQLVLTADIGETEGLLLDTETGKITLIS